ncbi:MAG TPA: protein kinase [Thermoanaerobaculia bacterium]|nr:protein kinase [Thermoanaerobaculia bacterium]
MSSANTPTIGPLDPRDATPLPLEPGDVVAERYEVLRLLGSGGSAYVYAVRDRRIGDEIALKLLRGDVDVARSRREAEFARGSSSSRLVRAFDLVEADGLVFLTMELVPGGSLRDRLRREPLPVDEVIRLAGEILEALADLHALDIVHRDLKPGNLLLTADGHLKLSDFGIARRWTDEESRLTVTGATLGTIDYLSPEQAIGEDVDPRSDLYSFGVLLYEMLTGHLPFEAPSKVAAIGMRLQRRPADVRTLRRDTPRWLAAIVARLLQTKREDRYPSAQAVLRDLRRRRVGVGRPWMLPIALLLVLALLIGVWWMTRPPAVDNLVVGDPWAAIVRRDGGKEIAVALGYPNYTLSFLDPRTRRLLRSVALPSAGDKFPEYSNRYYPQELHVRDLNHDGNDEVLIAYGHHHNYYPWYLVLHELATGKSRIVFIASGQHEIAGFADVDQDGRPEVIVVGIANLLGWYSAVAAIRVRLDADAPAAYTPDRDDAPPGQGLFWYVLCPPGKLDRAGVTVDELARVIRLPYELGPVELSFEGIIERNRARERAYYHLRQARRSIKGGDGVVAVRHAEAGRQQAILAEDDTLTEWSKRVQGMALAHAGRATDATELFNAICERTEVAADAAFDAGTAFHLAGDLERAVEWYRRSVGSEDQRWVGRLEYERLQGLVLALGEMGRWADARRQLEAFSALAPSEDGQAEESQKYIAWRTGAPRATYDARQPTDPFRYVGLESELALTKNPRALLEKIEGELEIASETKRLVLLTKAEALHRAGEGEEALKTVREAYGLIRANRLTSVLDRGHLDLAAGRYGKIAEQNGQNAEAERVRAEAAALRWHPNRIPR